MGDITKNFSYSEFACSYDFYSYLGTKESKIAMESWSSVRIPPAVKGEIEKLAKNLQTLRDYFHSSIRINSGYRDPVYNEWLIKYAELKRKTDPSYPMPVRNSQHLFGRAADIVVIGYKPSAVKQAIEALISEGKMLEGGIGIYSNFVHYDIRGSNARWSG